jgi:hypothetical protein
MAQTVIGQGHGASGFVHWRDVKNLNTVLRLSNILLIS